MRTWIACGLSLLLASCGGSSSAEVAGEQALVLSGSYRYVSLRAEGGVATSVTSARATMSSASTFQLQDQLVVSEGVTTGPEDGPTVSYVAQVDGTFVIQGRATDGRVTPSGMLASTVSRGGAAEWTLLMKRKEDVTLADLEGTWSSMRMGRWGNDPYHYVDRRIQGISALGVGALAFPLRNRDGVVSNGVVVIGDDAYMVLPDGSVQLTTAGGSQYIGDMAADGDLMILSDIANNARVQVMVRIGALAPVVAYEGAFHLCHWFTNTATGAPGTRWGEWNIAAGVIDSVLSEVAGDGGKPSVLDLNKSGQYIEVTAPPSPPGILWTGYTSRAGDYGFLCGGWVDGNAPMLSVLMR